MAKKGESKSQKSLSVEKARFLKRRKHVWTIRSRPGPHRKGFSVPLGFVVRDLLGFSQSMFETKKILAVGQVLVNGTARKKPFFGVGIFDLVEIVSSKKKYRVVFDKNARLVLNELPKDSPNEKVSKILFKKAVKGGLVQLTTSEGFVFLQKQSKLCPCDSVRISLPEKKILESLEMGKGSLVYFIGGKNTSKTGKVSSITEGTFNRPKLVSVKTSDNEIVSTNEKNVMVIGKEKPAADLGEILVVKGIRGSD